MDVFTIYAGRATLGKQKQNKQGRKKNKKRKKGKGKGKRIINILLGTLAKCIPTEPQPEFVFPWHALLQKSNREQEQDSE